MSTVWIVAVSPQVSGLVSAARAAGDRVEAVVAGERRTADVVARSGVDAVHLLETSGDSPVEAAASAVAGVIAQAGAQVVVAGTDAASKVLAGAVAGALGAEVLTGVAQVGVTADGVNVERGALGGIVEARETWTSPVVLLADAGGAAEPTMDGAVDVVPVEWDALAVTSVERRVAAVEHANLPSAKRIVAVGRGLKAQEDVALVEALAEAIGAEVACSRPLAEGVDWFAKDRYVGVSGAHVAPELYIAIGISGQLQHMSGVKDAGTVVAINTDKDAPVFAQSDFGVVGDLYTVVPALTAAVK